MVKRRPYCAVFLILTLSLGLAGSLLRSATQGQAEVEGSERPSLWQMLTSGIEDLLGSLRQNELPEPPDTEQPKPAELGPEPDPVG